MRYYTKHQLRSYLTEITGKTNLSDLNSMVDDVLDILSQEFKKEKQPCQCNNEYCSCERE